MPVAASCTYARVQTRFLHRPSINGNTHTTGMGQADYTWHTFDCLPALQVCSEWGQRYFGTTGLSSVIVGHESAGCCACSHLAAMQHPPPDPDAFILIHRNSLLEA